MHFLMLYESFVSRREPGIEDSVKSEGIDGIDGSEGSDGSGGSVKVVVVMKLMNLANRMTQRRGANMRAAIVE